MTAALTLALTPAWFCCAAGFAVVALPMLAVYG